MTLTPSEDAIEQSLTTLRFAQKACFFSTSVRDDHQRSLVPWISEEGEAEDEIVVSRS